jgi:hypothetical protein
MAKRRYDVDYLDSVAHTEFFSEHGSASVDVVLKTVYIPKLRISTGGDNVTLAMLPSDMLKLAKALKRLAAFAKKHSRCEADRSE